MNEFAQALGLVGMACNVSSYQLKKKKHLLLCQVLGGSIFAIHFLLLGGWAGFMQNAVGVFRGLVFSRENWSKKASRIWTAVFFLAFVLCYVLIVTVIKKELSTADLIMELLPTLAMCLMTVTFGLLPASKIRAVSLVGSTLWLIYNIRYFTIGGIACEVLSIISSIVGIFRYDLKKAK